LVIGGRFAWAHLPKTAGDATFKLFGLFPDVVLFADPADRNEKHDVFASRPHEVEGKDLILNIRRLPAWILSYSHQMNQRGLYPDFEPMPMRSPRKMSRSTEPDRILSGFLEVGRDRITSWIRTEQLVDDFLTCAGRYTSIDSEQHANAYEIGRVNAKKYDHHIGAWFTADQIELMYQTNPIWASVEAEVYGGIQATKSRPTRRRLLAEALAPRQR
jgi:hypothetical protein